MHPRGTVSVLLIADTKKFFRNSLYLYNHNLIMTDLSNPVSQENVRCLGKNKRHKQRHN